MLKRTLLFLCCGMMGCLQMFGQYPPPAGQPGTTAIFKDSLIFKSWATACEVVRGFINISDTTITYDGQNRATYGNPTDATGIADEFVVTLGDGGTAIVHFSTPIGDGPGPDFAVFENGLSDQFLELGFVEVSSDGVRFVRFPAISLVQDTVQVPTFGNTDATKINNFAGKYRLFYGTPFDLSDLKDSAGINLQWISVVRIVDAVGCIQPPFATYDASGHIVNDPWPTPFNTGGFDLDAVGVINIGAVSTGENHSRVTLQVYPNPVNDLLTVIPSRRDAVKFTLRALDGSMVLQAGMNGPARVRIQNCASGIFIGMVTYSDGSTEFAKIVKD